MFLAVVVAACSSRHPVETRFIASQNDVSPYQQLQAIDSLMWRQPDSALMVLVDFATTPKADSLSAFEGHYCQMLLSELLYKNDYGQSNREKLLKAVGCFDSIVGTDETDARKADTRGVSLRERNAFLDARAHYINGVGFYERDNLVEACAEYLKTLELMETHFDEKDLVKNKAKFMEYTYNRLGNLFSMQYMMDAAISCFESSMAYSKIEPTSPICVSGSLLFIGKQYDKKREYNTALQYYEQALENLVDTNNVLYRDIVSAKALCVYDMTGEAEPSIRTMKGILDYIPDDAERLTRFLVIGALYAEEHCYDSAMVYLEPLFENSKDLKLRMVIATYYLRNIYDSLGYAEKANACRQFLADNNSLEGESKALTSQLENMYKAYTEQKQEKQTEAEHAKHIRKIVGFIVPIAVLLALAIIIVAKLRSRKLLKQQQKEAEQAHEEELRRLQVETQQRLEEADERHKEEMEKMRQLAIQKQKANVSALLEEQVCQQIICGIKVNNIKRSTKPKDYPELILDETQKIELSAAVEKHCNGFEDKLLRVYPQITSNDLNLCRLFLLGLEEKHAAVLLNRDYSAIRRQSLKLKEAFGTDKEVPFFLKELILNN